MDVVYPYKRSPADFELRYSLRSLYNVPHDRVIIAGDVPSTVRADRAVLVRNVRVGPDRYLSSTSNIFAAIYQADVSSEFIVMNDDIFVLKPWTFQHEDRGPLEAYLTDPTIKGDYRSRVTMTLGLLRSIGITDPLFYGLHTPTVYDRQKLIDLITEYPMPRYKYLLRTLYNNLFPRPSIRRDDVKVKSWPIEGELGDVLSVSDGVPLLPEFQNWINQQFPVASKYEVI